MFGARLWLPLALCGLAVALYVTKDHRRRRALSNLTRELDDEALRALYAAALVKVARYRQGPLPKPVPAREAELALTLATVLREHAFHRASLDPAPGYLRSRRALLRQADRLML
ncbi:hypothetical protein K1T73_02980 [Roseovarius sp. SCSIO 43702]|uniref:hypothetical protein n=1 Tax=Roseovarius sp. SCSIO 43702 TaxID=2823043 RepID=UPI001C736745|nr:hypothetical protein [Roseovarius sp. SCSIO 43702]QYX57382.1 hypothetical protein K1T73_02980 [Roseovarius sp. SCSIO 43702]